MVYQVEKSHVKVINELFAYLNQHSNYVVLRNYHNLPYEYGNDLDILIDKEHVSEAISILQKIAKEQNYNVKKTLKRYCYYGIYLEKNNEVFLIDFCTDFVKRWINYANKDLVLASRKKYKNFYIPIIEHEIGIIVFKELLTYKTVRKKYEDYFDEKIELLNKDNFFSLVKELISNNDIDAVWSILISRKICEIKMNIKPTIPNILKPIELVKWLYLRIKS